MYVYEMSMRPKKSQGFTFTADEMSGATVCLFI